MRKEKETIVIYLARNGIKGLIKGQAIMRNTRNIDYPIAYIRKDKGATEKEYSQVLDFMFYQK